MKRYERPMLSVRYFASTRILTVSGEAEWGDWDDALEEEGVLSTADDA